LAIVYTSRFVYGKSISASARETKNYYLKTAIMFIANGFVDETTGAVLDLAQKQGFPNQLLDRDSIADHFDASYRGFNVQARAELSQTRDHAAIVVESRNEVGIFIFLCVGSAVAMIGANLRFGIGASGNVTSNATKVFQCHPGGVTEATVIFSLGALGMGANIVLMALILAKQQLRRYATTAAIIIRPEIAAHRPVRGNSRVMTLARGNETKRRKDSPSEQRNSEN